jgi:hypothetical protein
MKNVWTRVAGGILLLIVGGLWMLQGSGSMGSSGGGMNGKGQWLWIGVVVAAVGLVLLAGGVRRLRTGKRS